MATRQFRGPINGHLKLGFWAAMIASLASAVTLSFVYPSVFAADDSLFYLVVGQHLSTSGAWTFNGLMPTNGVQPLWQLLTAGIVGLADLVGVQTPLAQLRLLFVLNWALAVVALAQVWRLLGRLGVSEAGRLLGVVLLGCCLCGPWGMFASEAHLVAVALLWLLLVMERWFTDGPSPVLAFAIGCAAAVMMLSRLDTVWVAAAAVVSLLLFSSGSALMKRLPLVALVVVTSAALVLPYLAWNVVRFGNLSPISGAIKVDVRSPRVAIEGIGLFGVGILALIWIGGLLGVLRKPRLNARVAIWLVPALGATLSSAFYVAFSRGPFTQWLWYFVPHAVALSLTLPLLVDRLLERHPGAATLAPVTARLACLGLAVGSVVLCSNRAYLGPSDSLWKDARSFSSEIVGAVPDDAVLATVDMPGVLGFISGHPVVALDGLTGDFKFQDRWRDDGVACALSDLNVEYLVTVNDIGTVGRDDHSVTLELSSWLHRERPSALIGRGPIAVSPKQRYALWRIESSC
ncbi:MAG: hypothetical protein WBA45_00645 [Microthrixaceae bacterium]